MFSISLLSKCFSEKVSLTLRNGYKSSISLEKLYPKSSLDYLSKAQVQVRFRTNKIDLKFLSKIIIIKLLRILAQMSLLVTFPLVIGEFFR